MKDADPIAFGERVRRRREGLRLSQARLGKLSGYSQTNIGWIEQGNAKRPARSALALAEALQTTADWLLWGTGRQEIGPPLMSDDEVMENYNLLSLEGRASITDAIAKLVDSERKKTKSR